MFVAGMLISMSRVRCTGIQTDGPDVIWVEHDGGTTSYVRGIRGDPRDFLRTRDVLTWSIRSTGWHWTALDMNYAEKKLFLADNIDRCAILWCDKQCSPSTIIAVLVVQLWTQCVGPCGNETPLSLVHRRYK